MTSRERLLAAIRREPVDAVPVRIWGFDHRQPHEEPTRRQLADAIRQYEPDLLGHWGPRIEGGTRVGSETETRPVARNDTFMEDVTTIHTPKGPLTKAYLRSLQGKPGYQSKYLLETPEDAGKWLSIPWTPPVVDCSDWPAAVERMGDDGLLVVGLGEAMYAINDLTGSETWGYWLMDERELLHELVSEASRRQLHTLKEMLAQGVVGVYGYVGPELCIPPLAGPRDFDDFVVRYDEPLHDLVHDAGGLIWVHCHGKMNQVLERFADEGVDCLNPLEPPPMGDVTIADARARIGGRMSLDGGIEVGDMELKTPAEIEQMTADAVWQSGDTGFILTLTSDLGHWPTLTPQVLANVRTFVATGRREGERAYACG